MIKKNKNNVDADLVIAYQSGNKKALTLLVKRWHLQFCKFAFWYVKDASIAKDIAQESWAVIYSKLDTLQHPEKFKSWAISIVNRKAIDFIRATGRELNKLHVFYDEKSKTTVSAEDKEGQDKMKKSLKDALGKLPKHQKIVIDLFYTQAYTLKEIAHLLEISVGTAKSRLFHAREKLKSKLKNKNYG